MVARQPRCCRVGEEGVGGDLSGGSHWRKDASVKLWKLGYKGPLTGKTVSIRTLSPCPEGLLK